MHHTYNKLCPGYLSTVVSYIQPKVICKPNHLNEGKMNILNWMEKDQHQQKKRKSLCDKTAFTCIQK